MSTRKLLGGIALLLALMLGGAGAALAQDTYPVDPPPDVGGDEEERDRDREGEGDRGRDADSGDRSPAVRGETASRDGVLAFTGLEVLGLVLVGAALLAAGVALVVWRRRRAALSQTGT